MGGSFPAQPVVVNEVSGKHLSFMKYAGNDDITRDIKVEHDQMAWLSYRRPGRALGTRPQVIGEIPPADVINSADADSRRVIREIA